MKQIVCFFLIFGFLGKMGIAQEKAAKGRSNAVSAGEDIPIGSFTRTHNLGIGLEYSLSNHQYGYMGYPAGKAIGSDDECRCGLLFW